MKKQFKSDLQLFKSQKIDHLSKEFKDHFENEIQLDITDLNENQIYQKNNLGFDYLYMYQQIVAQNIITSFSNDVKSDPEKNELLLLDVGSRVTDAIMFSNYFKTIYLEPKCPTVDNKVIAFPGSNLLTLRCEAQEINRHIADNTISIITSLHALEHFGLGRYGDTIDYFGDQRSLACFNKALRSGGYLILSVPFSFFNSPRVEFNRQRVYSYKTIDEMLDNSGFDLLQRYFICPLGTVRDNNGNIASPIINKELVDSLSKDKKNQMDGPGVYLTISKKRKG